MYAEGTRNKVYLAAGGGESDERQHLVLRAAREEVRLAAGQQ